MNKWSLLVLAVVGLLGCKPGTPSQYIQPADMEDILYDYHLGQAVAQLEEGVSMEQRNFDRSVNMAAVLKKHGVTQAEFDSSLVFYYTHSERFEKMYKRVAERLSDEALKLGASEGEVERYATLGQNGDTANVWEGNRTAVLIPYAPYNRVNFRQECDTTYHQGDTFLFNLMADFMYQSGTRDAVVCLAARLDNDSVVSRVNHISVSGINQLRLNIDEDRSVKELYGYFYLGKGNDKSATLKLMFLKDIRLIRFHQQRKENPVPKALPRDSIGLVRDSSLTRQRVKDSVISNNIKLKQE